MSLILFYFISYPWVDGATSCTYPWYKGRGIFGVEVRLLADQCYVMLFYHHYA